MKVLLCHTYYQQRGGEDQAFENEAWLLESHGHEVLRYTRHNEELQQDRALTLAKKTIWNQQVYDEVSTLIKDEKPDVLHCTNSFPLLSPAVLHSGHDANIAVVQSLRNYRMICPAGVFMRNGKVCEDCLGKKFAWPAIKHGCYRGSRAATLAITMMNSLHKYWGTWDQVVDQYLTLTDFSKNKFIESGLPSQRISIKPNMVHPDPHVGTNKTRSAIFVGRLSAEKGIETLLDAWDQLTDPIPLQIVGDGPLADLVRKRSSKNSLIEWLGALPFEQTCQKIRESAFLIMPSIWYETFGRTTIEAFATGTPVIASRMGAMQEIVSHAENGYLFEPGNSKELASYAQKMDASPDIRQSMGIAARNQYEKKYTAQASYQALISIYEKALDSRHQKITDSTVVTDRQSDSIEQNKNQSLV